MKACAVIAEFNPFHNGHQFLLDRAREITQADVIVVIMSGNFVQRGEPAIINKWERAQVALNNGADLIVEIPTEYAVSAARDFASAGVKIAQMLKVDYLAFGSETVNLDFEKKSQLLDREFDQNKNYNQNFASQLFADTDIASSNDILGINYAYWKIKLNCSFKLVPIRREQAGHLDDNINGQIASATSIRKAILNQSMEYQKTIPISMSHALTTTKNVSWEDYWQLLKYRLISTAADELSRIQGISEGFQNRILDNVEESQSFIQLMGRLKTKRYTYTNIQRSLTNIFLNIQNPRKDFSKTRLLAINQNGRRFIREKGLKQVIMTKVSKLDYQTYYQITKRADDVYQLIAPFGFGNAPIIK